jgi:hypothetical protein
MDEMLLNSGVDIYYDQKAADVVMEKRNPGELKRIRAVITAAKEGLKKFESDVFVDCTGDGDISAWAGAEYECGDCGDLQPGTIRYFTRTKKRIDFYRQEQFEKPLRETASPDLLHSDIFGLSVYQMLVKDGNNMNHISGFNGADSAGKTRAEIEGRRCVYRIMEALKKMGKDAEEIEISGCAPEVAMRETRRIIGDSYITMEDYISGREYDDGICYSFYCIDRHRKEDDGIFQIFIDENIFPQIPLSALIPKGIENLFTAGRCVSGDRNAHSAFRVKASCMAMGQAAGAAAAIASKECGGASRKADLKTIKTLLAENGALVPGLSEPEPLGHAVG